MISSSSLKDKTQEVLKPVAVSLSSVGVSPNFLTVLGFLFSLVSGIFVAFGELQKGALFFALSGFCDTLDGIVARVCGKKSKFGAFLDSFLDRYSDFFPLAGLCYLGHSLNSELLLVSSLFSILGSFATSYARARAESLGVECKVGFFERPERFFALLIALLSGYVAVVIALFALLTNFTALQRLMCAKEELN